MVPPVRLKSRCEVNAVVPTWSKMSPGLLAMTEDAVDTDNEAVDPTFDLDSSMKSDVDHI